MSTDRPNILILMTDQQRADHLSCAGHPVLQTPNMDRIANEGMRFSQCCTCSPICMPARASFISGLYPHNHHMWHNSGSLPENEESLFRRLQDAGYRTAHIGKSHYYPHAGDHLKDHEPYMHARGFDDIHETTGPWATCSTDSYMTDHWADLGLLDAFRDDYGKRRQHDGIAVWPSPLPEEEFLDSYIGRTAKEYLQEYDDERPFCTFVGFGGPHEPWDAPGRYATMYDPAQMPEPIEPTDPNPWVPGDLVSARKRARHEGLTPEVIAALRANYAGKVSLLDDWFGEILGVLDDRGLADNTLVVFWSDHGEMAGDHQCLHKSLFYESSVMVPLMFRWPGHIDAGAMRENVTTTVDIPATILDLVGVDAGNRSQGKSLQPLMEERLADHREVVFSEICPAKFGHIMARTDGWKYVMSAHGDSVWLGDLTSDPEELNNLIGHPAYEELEAGMRDYVLRFLASTQPRL